MTKEDYIQFRIQNENLLIIYHYYLEFNDKIILDFYEFKDLLNQWLMKLQQDYLDKRIVKAHAELLQQILERVISYYDKKFEILYLVVEGEVKTKRNKILIL